MAVKLHDKVIYKKLTYEVKMSTIQTLCIDTQEGRLYLKNIENEYEISEIHYSKMEFGGATATVLSIAKNSSSAIVYLELIGQEDMVKSITSVIMQGRVKMNDAFLCISSGGYFQVNKAGNKRLLQQVGDGIVHSIVYHSPSIKDTNFDVLIGRDRESLLASFTNWMDKTNPMPYPKELIAEIYEEMIVREQLDELESIGVQAISIKDDIGLNEYEILREIIIKVSVENGIMNEYVEREDDIFQMKLPKSPLLTTIQVEQIYKKLATLPDTYETDGHKLKPIGIKLFGGPATIYVVEKDISAGKKIDGQVQRNSQCFGYVDIGQGGEWGYIDFDTYIEVGLEMDLYFENRYMDNAGSIYTYKDVEKAANELKVSVDEFIKNYGFSKRQSA